MKIKLKYFDPTDLTTLGLNPKELATIEKTKWFKKGGNINYFINGGATKKAIQLTLFPEIEEQAAQLLKIRNSKRAKKAAVTRKAKFEALPEFEQEIILNGKTLAKKQKQLVKDVEESQKAIASGKFIPEIKWDPEEWLQMRKKMDQYDPSLKPGESYGKPASETNPKGYTAKDIELFKQHIPELQALEFKAKKEGTWMKNSDSSAFNGDPRIWLMWQLENTKHYQPQTLWTGMDAKKAANFMTYDGRIFSTSQQSSDFGGHSIPFRTSTSGFETFDAEGRTYDQVLFRNGVRIGTDKLLADTKGRGIIVNNVNENWGDVGDAMGEAIQGASTVTDYAFNPGHPRWFLYGNTGNFNIGFNKQGGTLKMQEGGIVEKPVYQDFKIPEQQFVFRHLANEEQAKQFDQDLADLFYREEIKHGQLTKEGRQELQRKYNLSQQQVEDTLDDLLGFGLGEALVADLLQTDQEISIDKSIDFDKQGGVLKMSFGGAAMRALVPKAAESLTSIVPKIGTSEAQQLLIKSLANGEMTELTLNAIARGKSDELIKALKRTDTFKDLLKGEKVITEADTKILDALFHPEGLQQLRSIY